MYFQSRFSFFSFLFALFFFFLHLCGEACQCSGIRHCVVNTTVKQTAVKFLLIDLQSLAMSSWRHSMSSRALWVILACGSAIDRVRPPGVKKSKWRVSKKKPPKKNTAANFGKVVKNLKLWADYKSYFVTCFHFSIKA